MATTNRPQVTKLDNGDVRITITHRYGDQTSTTLDPTQAAALVSDLLTVGLPDNHLTQRLHGTH